MASGDSVDHERVGLHGRRRVVERVRVLGRLALQLALVRQRPRAAVAEESGTCYVIKTSNDKFLAYFDYADQ